MLLAGAGVLVGRKYPRLKPLYVTIVAIVLCRRRDDPCVWPEETAAIGVTIGAIVLSVAGGTVLAFALIRMHAP